MAIIDGHTSNEALAVVFGCRRKIASDRVARLCKRLGATDRTQAVLMALGEIPGPSWLQQYAWHHRDYAIADGAVAGIAYAVKAVLTEYGQKRLAEALASPEAHHA